MELTINADNSVTWQRELTEKYSLKLHAQEIRRQSTGLHAQVTISINSVLLAYDTFNIGRQEERVRLARAAHTHFKNGLGESYPVDHMKHDLDEFCRDLPTAYEQDRFTITHYDAEETVPGIKMIIDPYLIEGGGTVFFAPPGSGKSYLLMTIAACISAGICSLWNVEWRPVLYVNLERSGVSMQRRFHYIAKALGIKGRNHSLEFLHARGQSFKTLTKRVDKWRAEHPGGVGIVDSISRSGEGSLVKDDVANDIVDWMNARFESWAAIGHTSRASEEHIFGSVHFDAGEDIGVQVVSDVKPDGELGVMLQIVKANDISKPPAQCIAFNFDGENLSGIKIGKTTDFGKMILSKAETDIDKLTAYLLSRGYATATDAAKDTGVNRANASNLLHNASRFMVHHKEGTKVFYSVKEDGQGRF